MSDAVADFAILMIAVHSALCVFNPGGRIGENGLYPYRYIAYALWVIFPILMASLAFVNTYDAYAASPSSCYLPVRPYWYRLGFSWVPRYIILIAITTIYLSMNLYVRYIFKSFKLTLGSSYEESEHTPDTFADSELGYQSPPPRDVGLTIDPRLQLPPRMPRLSCHGLIPPTPVTTGLPDISEVQSVSPHFSETPPKRAWRNYSIARRGWDGPPFDGSAPSGGTRMGRADSDAASSRGRQGSAGDYYPEETYSYSLPSQETAEEQRPWERSTLSQSPTTKIPQRLKLVDSREDSTMRQLRHTRDTIRRQLRLLFIYPLVYVLTWIIPFISHCLQFNDQYAYNPSFALVCLVTAIIPLQCAVDCWVFSSREKPWRLIPGSKGTFWDSFLFWNHRGPECQNVRFIHGPGKSRAEMLAAAREAYRRRDEELRSAAEEFRKRQRNRELGKREDDRAWWEGGETGWRENIWQDSIVEDGAERNGRPRLGRLDTGRTSLSQYGIGPLSNGVAPP
ncbi:hypothetical protein FGG08_000334 [Glutinoglossum americanum]|uniref:G protein-coupled receptor GPR1 n=1 Tax=Glutinoglossum americanum TaxID=1670608 RepID=A0A9P8I3W7_9PEZI|nr:hypothetical protein FGG08_000334 [Glutinoglossum americanum]